MEGQELQRDNAEDALQAVHSLWQLNGLVGDLSHFRVILATEDDGSPLVWTQPEVSHVPVTHQSLCVLCFPELTDLAVICCRAFWHLL